MDDGRKARARRRAEAASRWPGRSYPLGHEPVRDPYDHSSAEQRLGWMWPLAKEAWALAGRPIPDYTRAQTPGKVLRGTDGDDA